METSSLGIVLDTSVVIAQERRGCDVAAALHTLRERFGDVAIALSAVSVAELAHGVERANTELRRLQRQEFLDELLRDIPVYPVTERIARLAGKTAGALAACGIQLSMEDALIAATAMHENFAVATLNVRHFEAIPGLQLARR